MTKRTARTMLAGATAAAAIGLLVGLLFALPSELAPILAGAALGGLVWLPVGVLLHRDGPSWVQIRRNRPRLPL